MEDNNMIKKYIEDNNIEVAIFDMDGTLTDSNQTWSNCLEIVMKRHNIVFTQEEWKHVMCVPTLEAARYLADIGRLDMDPVDFTAETNAEGGRMYREEVELKPGAIELLKTLQGMGIKMYIASSTERKELELALKIFGMIDFFEDIYPVVELGTSKSDPKCFEFMLDKAGAKAENAILFEDALYSMKTGKSVGMHVVAIKDDFEAEQEDAIAELADIYVENPENLLEA